MPLTLPQICAAIGASIDTARRIIRQRPDLAQLGERIGPTRVFDRAAAAKIKAALTERAAAKCA